MESVKHVNTIMRDMFRQYPTARERKESRLRQRDKYMPVIRRMLDMEPGENRRAS